MLSCVYGENPTCHVFVQSGHMRWLHVPLTRLARLSGSIGLARWIARWLFRVHEIAGEKRRHERSMLGIVQPSAMEPHRRQPNGDHREYNKFPSDLSPHIMLL